MKDYLSPKELAQALGASESSVKRWADGGLIGVTRTAGGHRRIARQEAVDFVRRGNAPVARPEILGFEEAGRIAWQGLDEAAHGEMLFRALVEGDWASAFGLVHGPFLSGRPLAWIFDGPLSAAMHRIGQLWEHQADGIMIEHRATDICLQALMRIRLSLTPGPEAPAALGGACHDDPYLLASLAATTVLRDLGLNDTNLGPRTPVKAFLEAAARLRPLLTWLSVSTDKAAERLRPHLLALAADLADVDSCLIVGGRAVEALADLRAANLTVAQSMSELAGFARGLLAARRRR